MSMYSYVGWVGGFVTNCLLSQMGREIGFYGTPWEIIKAFFFFEN